MEPQPLTLGHRDLLFDRLRAVDIPVSEFSFANLYLFRDTHRYEVLTDGEVVWLRGRSYDGHAYLMPTTDVRNMDPEGLRAAAGLADFLYPVPEQWLSAFPGDLFRWTFEEGDSDYLFLTERIATYAGKAMHKKKNLLNHFVKHYQHEALPLTEDRLSDAVRILNRWQDESGQTTGDTDFAACRESLVRMEELVLCGGIFYADGEPAGFVHGEELNDSTYALHFAKGLTRFKGIYQYMFNSFALVLPDRYRYLNFEQDLGMEALRHMKQSYLPETMLKKYRVSLKK